MILEFSTLARAMLFDLGDIGALPPRAVLRISDVFVSHAHVDHFIGFDRLLRLRLSHPHALALTGPAGFADRVAAKLAAYSWNLLDETSPDFVLTASEFSGDQVTRRIRFRARHRFAWEALAAPALAPGILLDEPSFTVTATELDHGTPCLAFALAERPRLHASVHAVARLGLAPGPWINAVKQAIRAGRDDTAAIVVAGAPWRLGDLRDVVASTPGLKIAYAVDAADHADNRARIIALAEGAHALFIEAAFADEDEALARRKRHLTAGAAGRIARAAGVERVIPLHHSARYADRPDALAAQVAAAFEG